MAVTRADLLAGVGRPRPERLEVAGLGTVYLRWPTFAEWYPLILEQAKHEGAPVPDAVVARTIVACLCDENGERLLSEADAAALLEQPPAIVMALYNGCKNVLASASSNAEEVAGE